MEDYSYTSFRAGSKKVGFEDKYKDMKQFFSKKLEKKRLPMTIMKKRRMLKMLQHTYEMV